MASDEPSEQARTEFEGFYREDLPKLVVFLVLHGVRPEDAKDVAQVTMTRAWQLWQEIRRPRAWVRTVAYREWIRWSVTLEEPRQQVMEGSLLLQAQADQNEWETRHQVITAVRSLPPRQRQVVAWALDGFTPAETAHALNMKPEAVRGSLKLARQTLRKVLRPQENDQ